MMIPAKNAPEYFERRHGFAGALRAAQGGMGGPFEAPHLQEITC